MRDRALFDLAIDSKLRGCDLVKIKIGTLVTGQEIRTRAMVIQQKTGRPVQFEITAEVRASLLAWLQRRGGTIDDFAFPSRVDHTDHLSTRQYARLVDEWVTSSSSVPLPGTRLIREWNGRRYVVEVVESGFVMDGKTYRSLSAIAFRITGTHWSGPRFFGL